MEDMYQDTWMAASIGLSCTVQQGVGKGRFDQSGCFCVEEGKAGADWSWKEARSIE